MSDLPMMLSHINECFNFSLSEIDQAHKTQNHALSIDSNVYQQILKKVEGEYGHSFLKFSITPENYMKYKNGKVSSIIKGDSGFKSHEGFEAVKMVNLVDSIFSEVSQYYTSTILN
jgi:uncharacterized membrane protein